MATGSGSSGGGGDRPGLVLGASGLLAAITLAWGAARGTVTQDDLDSALAAIDRQCVERITAITDRINHVSAESASGLQAARSSAGEISSAIQRLEAVRNEVARLRSELESKTSDRFRRGEFEPVKERLIADAVRLDKEVRELRAWVLDLQRRHMIEGAP